MATERRMFESPTLKAVICNSEMVRDEILGYFDIPENKLHVIYSGVDTDRFHPRLKEHRHNIRESLEIPNDHSLFLFVGSGFERKGAAAVIRALAHLPDTAHGVIVGEDKHRKRYEELAKGLSLNKRVHFLGKQADVGPYYGAADAVVLPTLYDPFPNVILEAMACGLPVITSSKSGGAEFISQGENGYVCDALDIEAIVRSMQELMIPATALRQGEAARQTIEPYDLESMGRAMTDLYKDLLLTDSESC
jgi:UDP-glucose:(heptosyl)LPS alpha-1,3-glucosyltransferase